MSWAKSGDSRMPNKTRTPNDQRSDVKNPNNQDFKAARDNRANQLNPNNEPKSRQPNPRGGSR